MERVFFVKGRFLQAKKEGQMHRKPPKGGTRIKKGSRICNSLVRKKKMLERHD